jgi:hypothetical protein
MTRNGQAAHDTDRGLDTLYAFWPGTAPAPAPLPEAPASANVRVLIAGHEVQVTLRDTDETALLARLAALLKRADIRPIPKPAPRTGAWTKGR